ncbi:MAG: FkbM family methyltransferase [Chitinophagaceae bacterium]|nr:FkbM family methyltransferase [Chitinophagaceae bacterium]
MKEFIRKIINTLGYDIVKYNVHSADKAKKTFPVHVGNYNILMPGNNPLISLYKYQPWSNSQIGDLAKLVVKKYADAVMIDTGANVGDTVAVVKSKVEIPIIAIEGDTFSFSFLKKNATQFQNLFLLKAFLGEEQKKIAVTMGKDGWNNTIIPDEQSSNQLELKTMDNLLKDENLFSKNIKLLKIDTEGFDTIILRGCRNLLEKHKPVLFFEYNGENMKSIKENGYETLINLKKYGYKRVHVYDCINNLILVTTLENEDLLKQLDTYSQLDNSMIKYYDMCIFHENDIDLSLNYK